MRNQNKLKRQDTGFTLIELLAVITIMGILLLVAVPAISNTIKNSRKDTFASTASKIADSVKNLAAVDSIVCSDTKFSGLKDGTYYVAFKTGDDVKSGSSVTQVGLNSLLDGGAVSPFGDKDLEGYVKIIINNGTYEYTISIGDGAYAIKNTNPKGLTRQDVETDTSSYNMTTTCTVNKG